MESNRSVENKNFFELNEFLKKYLMELEKEVNNFLISKNWLIYLIKKQLVLDKVSASELIKKKGNFQLITYSLNFVFFNDIEDNYGQRPNDVTLGFVLRISTDNKILLTRDIVSDLNDIDYPIIYYNTLTKEIKNSILKMSKSYVKIVTDFIEDYINSSKLAAK